jgi:dihydropteroate synthase
MNTEAATPDLRLAVRDELLGRLSRERLIMGVLNVTPDSFSDGGRYLKAEDAIAHAIAMRADGADIIDVGGESTRPGATPVSEGEERVRIEAIVAAVATQVPTPISIDTYKSGIARAAAAAGAVIVNDVWGMTRDVDMPRVVAETGSLVVVTYNRGAIDPSITIADDMRTFFDAAFSTAAVAGIPREHIILDPGIGFAKTYEQNVEALSRLDVLHSYRRPILVGVSRKSFLGRLTGLPVDQRLNATLSAGLAAISRGASILRVHDVAAHSQAFAVLKALETYA